MVLVSLALLVCDPLVGVATSAVGMVYATSVSGLSYRQSQWAEFLPAAGAGEGEQPGLAWCCLSTIETVVSSRVGMV